MGQGVLLDGWGGCNHSKISTYRCVCSVSGGMSPGRGRAGGPRVAARSSGGRWAGGRRRGRDCGGLATWRGGAHRFHVGGGTSWDSNPFAQALFCEMPQPDTPPRCLRKWGRGVFKSSRISTHVVTPTSTTGGMRKGSHCTAQIDSPNKYPTPFSITSPWLRISVRPSAALFYELEFRLENHTPPTPPAWRWPGPGSNKQTNQGATSKEEGGGKF